MSLSPDALQFSETAEQYGGLAGYAQAIEIGATELPYERWIQVRTSAFKAEFGDWQFAREYRATRIATDKNEAKRILHNLRDITIVNQETGMASSLSRKSQNKILSGKAFKKTLETASGSVHLNAAANIDFLYTNGILGWIKPDRKQDSNILGLPRFFTPIYLDNQLYLCQTTVKRIINPVANRIYTIEGINILNTKQIEQKFKLDFLSLEVEKGNNVPDKITTADLSETKLTFVGPHNVSRVLTIAEKIIEYNQSSVAQHLHPHTFEPTLDFLTRSVPSPLIDLNGLGNREAARKLHDSVAGDIRHLPLVLASAEAAGKRVNISALHQAAQLHPIERKDAWLKAVTEHPRQKPRTQDKDITR